MEPAQLPQVAKPGRPCPVAMRGDLIVRGATFQGEACWLVKNPLSLEYHRLHPAQYRILSLCDGRRSLERIRLEFLREFPMQRLTPWDLQTLIGEFHRQGLVVSDRPDQAETLALRAATTRSREFWQAARNVLFLRLPGWNAEPLLNRLQPWVGWLFRPPGVLAGCALILAGWLLLAIRSQDLAQDWTLFRQHFGLSNFVWLWVTLGTAKVLHELGHGLCCREMGGECHEIGVAFLVFSPSLYCDVSDSWMLPQKWRRIAIGAAGMYVELMIASVALAVWATTRSGLIHFLALNTFCVTTLTTILFNANPLLQYDGYYMTADLLEIPNLRSRSDRLLGRFCLKQFLGVETPADPFLPGAGRGWLAIYAAAAAIYRWGMLFSLAFVLHDVLSPWGLGGIGTAWGCLSAVIALGRIGWNTGRALQGQERNSMRPFRILCTALAAASVAGVIFLVPIPVRSELPIVVEPHDFRAVYAQVSGELVEQRVEPGQRVDEGDVLLELRNFEQADQLARLRTARDTQKIELKIQRKLNQAAGVKLAEETLERLESQITELESQQDRLIIVAPCAGRVIASPKRPAAPEGRDRSSARWSGSILDRRNHLAWIETGTHLLSIAPDDRFEARAFIEQSQRNDVANQTQVALKLEFQPDRKLPAALTMISERHVDTVPDALSNKFGGPLATQVDAAGHERLPSAAFVGLISLPNDATAPLPGMRGRARFNIEHRTAAQWIWRLVRATFQFRL